MARTSSFRAGETSVPTGLIVPSSEEDGQAVEELDARHAGPENNGIDPHNVMGTTFEEAEGVNGLTGPEETIDETDPVGDSEKKYARARGQKNDGLGIDEVPDFERNSSGQKAELDETDDESRSDVTEQLGADELPAVEHPTGNEQDVHIDSETDELQEESNTSSEPATLPDEHEEDPTTGNSTPESGRTDGQAGLADTSTEAPEDQQARETVEQEHVSELGVSDDGSAPAATIDPEGEPATDANEADDVDAADKGTIAEQSRSEAAYPEGEPKSTWNVDQINAWAEAQSPKVEFPEGATKKQKLAQINASAEESKDN
jgi:hypothetical protein